MRIDFVLNDFDSWDFGFSMKMAEDDIGPHRYFVIGLIFFNIEFSNYNIS